VRVPSLQELDRVRVRLHLGHGGRQVQEEGGVGTLEVPTEWEAHQVAEVLPVKRVLLGEYLDAEAGVAKVRRLDLVLVEVLSASGLELVQDVEDEERCCADFCRWHLASEPVHVDALGS